MKKWCLILLGVEILLIIISLLVTLTIVHHLSSHISLPKYMSTVFVCGYCMTLTHIVKYMPQLVLNYRRKSTVGLNIKFVLLDLIGACFSLLQLAMNAIDYS